MKQTSLIALSLLLLSALPSQAQDTVAKPPILIKRDNKTIDLNKLTILEIIYYVPGAVQDSVERSIVPSLVVKKGDTLIVRPEIVVEDHLLNQQNLYSVRQYYDYSTSVEYKIPIYQIDKIRAKKQPIAFILGTTSTLAYLTYMGSMIVAVSSSGNDEVLAKTFLGSATVLALAWPSYFIWGKKRFRFDDRRTGKKTWGFQ